MSKKLWGGRFLKQTDKEVESFTASIHFGRIRGIRGGEFGGHNTISGIDLPGI